MPLVVVLATEALGHRQPRATTNMAVNCDSEKREDMEEEEEE